MKTIGVDPDCLMLARLFVHDERTRREMSDATYEAAKQSLAEAIQTAIEDWFAAQNWEPR
jgi:hypothetical protein